MRLRLASSAAAEKLVKPRTTPGSTSEVTAKFSLSLPKNVESTSAPAALTPPWAPGEERSGAVGASGVQCGAPAVAGFPSLAAARIAVMGRQKWYVYLAS